MAFSCVKSAFRSLDTLKTIPNWFLCLWYLISSNSSKNPLLEGASQSKALTLPAQYFANFPIVYLLKSNHITLLPRYEYVQITIPAFLEFTALLFTFKNAPLQQNLLKNYTLPHYLSDSTQNTNPSQNAPFSILKKQPSFHISIHNPCCWFLYNVPILFCVLVMPILPICSVSVLRQERFILLFQPPLQQHVTVTCISSD